MCTAITYQTKDHYFGRNLDLEHAFREAVTVTPRHFPFPFRKTRTMNTHFAMIGMASVVDGYPLYYDATNEFGLSMAGLNFPSNAVYYPETSGMDNITPFELIPWILGQCKTVTEARNLLSRLNLVNIPFSEEIPLSPLHFLLADKHESIVFEPVADGLRIYDNPVGILTNNPTFDFHLHNLCQYRNLTREEPESRFSPGFSLKPFSRGMGAIGLPGDLSSASRFVRAAFTKLNSVSGEAEEESVSQFFHILGSVTQTRGCARVGKDFEITLYSSCCNTDKGIYYYTTYENSGISAVDMHRENLDRTTLISYPILTKAQIQFVN